MPFTPVTKQPGDLARAQEWNEAMTEVVRLENAKVAKAGDTMTGALTSGALTIGPWPANPSNYVFFGTNALNQSQAGNYALLQGSGSETGSTFLNSPENIRFRIANATHMILANNGNVGIGLTDPQARLHIAYNSDVTPTGGGTLVIGDLGGENLAMDNNEIMARNNGNTSPLFLQFQGGDLRVRNDVLVVKDSTNNVGIGTTSPSSDYKLHVIGNVGASGFVETSDVRWKKNMTPIPDALRKVLQLRGVQFEWNTADYAEMNFPAGRHIGLVAQEVEQVIPEVVSTAEDGYKSVAYANLVAVLVEAVKELQAEVESLKAALQAQETVPGNGRQPALATD
ncbi:MAG: tail fiber domain-containing protein [Chloroflexi bacterium]|nr:tail fiber domain-containing protein [Chloroflexota bacterium]MCI0577001.1 tail fiber domain-containing protein [Chloroflexota bacterium]MCI0647778.1 tail fiber domain-containing protein [Chloroflexota bacterium]MCI0729020.1 tail fiber domain-containing protein [Chloroflexota bacterium]